MIYSYSLEITCLLMLDHQMFFSQLVDSHAALSILLEVSDPQYQILAGCDSPLPGKEGGFG